MNKISLLFVAVLFAFAGIAQSRTTTVEFQKINRQAIINEFPFAEKTTRNAIDEKFEKMGYKGKDVKGYVVYRGVSLANIGPDSYDLYFMVDRKSKKEKDIAVVTMLISKGFDSFLSDSTGTNVMNNGKRYLDSLISVIAAYDLELQIKDQEDALKSNEKKAANLIGDGEDLQKEKQKIERKIEENIKNQASQKLEVEKQKQILDVLKAKRKS